MNMVGYKSPLSFEEEEISSCPINENGMTISGSVLSDDNTEAPGPGVNLGFLVGVSGATMSSSTKSSLLVASSIAPHNPNEMNRGRLPVNSSLATAAASGGSSLQIDPSSGIDPNQSSSATDSIIPNPSDNSPPSPVAELVPGSSSLAAAATILGTHEEQQQQQQQQQSPYHNSQMQMHHQYQAQIHYKTQHPQSFSAPHPQLQHPSTLHHSSHPLAHAHSLAHRHYLPHQLPPGTAAMYGPPSAAFSDHVSPTAKPTSAAASGISPGPEYKNQYVADVNEYPVDTGDEVEEKENRDTDFNEPVKLFVGQVPKSMEEADLTLAFQDYGEIKEILIIRDRHTGQHRGCAFVTFYDPAHAAHVQETLHDKFTFPDGRKPVQIKPASEPATSIIPTITPEQENKLFVGMTSRNADEDSIRELFSPFGEIREIYIIRNADGSNKGCAFLKYTDNESALNAIETLNDIFTMEGATRPLIVKFADTKAQRKARSSAHARLIAGHRLHSHSNTHPTPQTGYYPLGPHVHVPVYPNYQQPPPPMGIPPQYTQQPYSGSYPQSSPPSHHSYMYHQHPYAQSSPYGYPAPPGSFATGQTSHAHADGSPVPSSSASYEDSTSGNVNAIVVPPPHFVHAHPQTRSSLASRQQQDGSGMPRVQKPYQRQEITGAVNPRPREGPAGANLFIYHLPHDLTDADLATAFNPFGNVISAKVYVDKFTGESKGFGFVSYDSVISAEQAIEQMNGFQIGSKRLKVQHKRVSKPPSGQQKGSVNPENSIVPSSMASMHPDSTVVMGTLPPSFQHHYHPHEYHHHQSLSPHLDVDGLTGDLQILDVGYQEEEG